MIHTLKRCIALSALCFSSLVYTYTSQFHLVKQGDTLYSIAFAHDMDYHDLATANNIHQPYVVYAGQMLRLRTTQISESSRLSTLHARVFNKGDMESHMRLYPHGLMWPTTGRVVAGFNRNRGQKGIHIQGSRNQTIRAVLPGVVAYAGQGLLGYGNLIIVKHPNRVLTAYGNNARNMVREGDHVRQGQVIATMGKLRRTQYGLHFEIRQAGKPVNPLYYLQRS